MDTKTEPSTEIATMIGDSGDVALQRELTWGISYRAWHLPEEKAPIKPKHSPINVPFKLCRAKDRLSNKKDPKKCNCKPPKDPPPSTSLLDRIALSQKKYMELLSTPNQNYTSSISSKEKKKKRCCKCEIEPCPPRLVQMAVPKKRYVWENWKAYQDLLPAEILMRFDQILRSGNNSLEPKDARYYFKQIDKKKRQIAKRKKQKKRQKEREDNNNKGYKLWVKEQIKLTSNAITESIKHDPFFTLNFRQMMLSNEILRYLGDQRVIKIKTRATKNVYKKKVVEISDKVAKWMDNLNNLVEIRPLTSQEELVLDVPSLEHLLEQEEEEYEEEEEEEGEEGYGEEGLFSQMEEGSIFGYYEGEEMGRQPMGYQMEDFLAQKLVDKTDKFQDYEDGEDAGMKFLEEYSIDELERLIKILSQSSPEELAQQVNPDVAPGKTYQELLDKLKEIRDGQFNVPERKPLLEDTMIEWARNNDPDQVDDKMLGKIRETSDLLEDWLMSQRHDESTRKAGDGTTEEMAAPLEKGLDETEGGAADGAPDEESSAAGALPEADTEGAAGAEGAEADVAEVIDEAPAEGTEEAAAEGTEEAPAEGVDGASPEAEEGPMEVVEEIMEKKQVEETEAMPKGADEGGEETGMTGEEGEVAEGEIDGTALAEGEGAPGEGEEGDQVPGEGEESGKFAAEGEEIAEGEGIQGEGIPGEEGEGVPGEEGEGISGEEKEREVVTGEEAKGEAIIGAEGERIPGEKDQEVVVERLDDFLLIIRGHKPPEVFDHSPDTICCLSLKIWAIWLLEIAHNAHNWTKWIGEIIKQVREYAAIIRGDVLLPNGQKKVLYKEDWRKFVAETEEKIIAWRQYSAHVKNLSNEIVETFHGKKVNCCPKCLQDHMIKNVVTAHDTLESLTEAINCAGYWQRCLDRIVEQTSKLTNIEFAGEVKETPSDTSGSCYVEIEELHTVPRTVSEVSSESLYEIEELVP